MRIEIVVRKAVPAAPRLATGAVCQLQPAAAITIIAEIDIAGGRPAIAKAHTHTILFISYFILYNTKTTFLRGTNINNYF